MRKITFKISGETPEDEKLFECAIDLAVEKLHDDYTKVGYSVVYHDRLPSPTGESHG